MKFESSGNGGYPVHEYWSERDRKGNETVHDCGGLVMSPEEAGLRTPPRNPLLEQYPVACTLCSKCTGRVVFVDKAKYERAIAASNRKPGSLGPLTLTLGHLTKAARQILCDAYYMRIAEAAGAPAKPFMELYDHGLIAHNGEITDAGVELGVAAGWAPPGARVAS